MYISIDDQLVVSWKEIFLCAQYFFDELMSTAILSAIVKQISRLKSYRY